MYYVYVLRSLKDKKFYVGFTNNVRVRYQLHREGKVPSTKPRRPLKIIYVECYLHKHDALNREKYMKSGWGRRYLQKTLQHFLQGNLMSK